MTRTDFISSLRLLKCQLSSMLVDNITISSRSIVLNWLNSLEFYVIYSNHNTVIIDNNRMPIDSRYDDRLVDDTPSSIHIITPSSGSGSGVPIDGRTIWNFSLLVDTIMCEALSLHHLDRHASQSSSSSSSLSSSIVASEVEVKPSSTMKPSSPSPLSSLSTNIVLFSISLLGHLLQICQLFHSDNTSIDDDADIDDYDGYHHGGDVEYTTTAAARGGDRILKKVISIVYHALEHPDARVREQISVTIRILYSSRSFDLNLSNPSTKLQPNLNLPNTELLPNLSNLSTTQLLLNLHDYIVAHIQHHWCRSVSMRGTVLGDEPEIAMDDTTGDCDDR